MTSLGHCPPVLVPTEGFQRVSISFVFRLRSAAATLCVIRFSILLCYVLYYFILVCTICEESPVFKKRVSSGSGWFRTSYSMGMLAANTCSCLAQPAFSSDMVSPLQLLVHLGL